MNLIKKSLLTSLAATALLSAGLMANTTTADAAAKHIVRTNHVTYLYTKKGASVKNRALSAHSDWLVGKVISINGQTYDQVATNEYVIESEVTDVSNQAPVQKSSGVVFDGNAALYNDQTGKMDGNSLPDGTFWTVTRAVINKNNVVFYKVSAHEWAASQHLYVKNLNSEVEYSPDFGLNASDPNAKNSASVTAMQSAIYATINSERAKNGVGALKTDSSINNIAMTRAKELAQQFDHMRPNGEYFDSAFAEANYPTNGVGENIGAFYKASKFKTGQAASDALLKMFLEEPGQMHYYNMIRSDYTSVGVGVYIDQMGQLWIAQDFAM
ncbi:CAP domain-containing protein [Companilactobacillus hulinensis]|uniref:CAP domain-containing protein n=1 Tax=Companilactobacillus hulinensis TaxID=2486007 RepID=UPI0013DDDF9D|nr:CAP domain-containing protein [Companilactobacillus hulinensis]